MNTLAHPLRTSRVAARAPWRAARAADDPLRAMRGILFGMLVSVLGFWLPLAMTIAH
jgi:hypothetical protein